MNAVILLIVLWLGYHREQPFTICTEDLGKGTKCTGAKFIDDVKVGTLQVVRMTQRFFREKRWVTRMAKKLADGI